MPTGGIRQTLNNYSSFIYLSHSLSLSVLSLPSFSILIFLLTWHCWAIYCVPQSTFSSVENMNCLDLQLLIFCKPRYIGLKPYICHQVKSLSRVWFCDPMDCSPPGYSVHGIFQAGTLEWDAISFLFNIRVCSKFSTICQSLSCNISSSTFLQIQDVAKPFPTMENGDFHEHFNVLT